MSSVSIIAFWLIVIFIIVLSCLLCDYCVLFFFYLVPPTIEVRDVMTGQSIIQVFNITSLAGDQGFVYSCQSEGFPVPTVTWSRAGGLPAGVTQRRSNSQLVLEWNRMLEYTDSGLYTCTTTNNIGERTVVLNLLVEGNFIFFIIIVTFLYTYLLLLF